MYFILHYDKRILTERPGSYIAKVADQIQHFYVGADGLPAYSVYESDRMNSLVDMTFEMTSKPEFSRPSLQGYRASVEHSYTHWQWYSGFIEYAKWFMAFARAFNALLIIFLLQQAAMFYSKRKRLPLNVIKMRELAAYMLAVQIALVLTVALIHSFDIHRYGVWIAPATVLATGLLAVAVVSTFATMLTSHD